MAIRLIALDLDDTLLTPELSISPGNRQALATAAENGVRIVLATGRMVQSTLPFAEMLGLKDIICLCYNGALVQTVSDGKVLDASPVSLDAAKRVIGRFIDHGFAVNVYHNDKLYQEKETPRGREYARIAGVEPTIVHQDLRMFLSGPPHKVLGMSQPEILDEIQPILAKEFEGEVFFTRSKPGYLEALQWGLSKGAALERLACKLGLRQEEVMAVGDAPNDMEMLSWAGVGVAMGNGHPTALKVADVIAPDHREDGVAWAVRKYVMPL